MFGTMLEEILIDALCGILEVSVSALMAGSKPEFRRTQAARLARSDSPELQRTYESACGRLVKDPHNVPALFERALVYRTWGQHLQALTDFCEVIRLQPKHARA